MKKNAIVQQTFDVMDYGEFWRRTNISLLR